MLRPQRWLLGELDAWQSESLIEAHQAEAIRLRYATPADSGLGRWMLSAIGAIIFGLGVILFFAYNWDDMPKLAKLSVVFGGLATCHGVGYWLATGSRDDGRDHSAKIEAMHMLGTMLFGAGIWLISQIYHFDNPYPGALLAWGLGALALAWALPSMPQAFAALGLIVGWSLDQTWNHPPEANYLTPILIAFAILPLAFRQRSKVMLLFGSAALLITLPAGAAADLKELAIYPLFFLSAAYLGVSQLARAYDRPELGPASIVGQLAYFVVLFVVSFEQAVGDFTEVPDTTLQSLLFFGPLAMALGVLAWAGAEVRRLGGSDRGRPELWTVASAMAGVLAFACLPHLLPEPLLAAPFFSLLLLGHGVALILQGSHLQSWKRATAGCLVISALVMARFADLFESLLLRSAAFLLLGLGLFAVGNYYQRHDSTRHQSVSEADHA